MEFQKYIDEKKDIHLSILAYFDDEKNAQESYLNLINQIEIQKIQEKQDELFVIFHIILKIAKSYHRSSNFFHKLKEVLLFFQNDIKRIFSNVGIYHFFKRSKYIILLLIKENILLLNYRMICYLIEFDSVYFYPEITTFFYYKQNENGTNLSNSKYYYNLFLKNINGFESYIESINGFEQKRLEGENDSYLCELIRNDSVEEFISYVNKTNTSLSRKISPSIFETSIALVNEKVSLIEYATFFGSIQIFQYLRLNEIELCDSLWFYAIHGRNYDIIHLLESEIILDQSSYLYCYEYAVCIYHNELADYIKENLIKDFRIYGDKYTQCYLDCYFMHHNYSIIPDDMSHHLLFCYLCKYDYSRIVRNLLEEKCLDFNINDTII